MLMTHTAHSPSFPVMLRSSEFDPSPEEVARRAQAIRNTWDPQERIARRREACFRLSHLVAYLRQDSAA